MVVWTSLNVAQVARNGNAAGPWLMSLVTAQGFFRSTVSFASLKVAYLADGIVCSF